MSMEEAFNKFVKERKNDVENLVKWMKEAKIIESTKESEDKARQLFHGADSSNVQLSKFKEVLAKIAEDQKKTVENLAQTLASEAPKALEALQAGTKQAMEKTFESLRREGKNNVDSLIKWLKESKIIDGAQRSEEDARKLFSGVDKANVEITKFKEVITHLAEEQKKTVESLLESLETQTPSILGRLTNGANALKEAIFNAISNATKSK